MNFTYFVSVACLVFCIFIFFYFKWYIKNRTSASELLTEYRTEVYRLIAEIDAATDRDSMLVEDRIKKIKAILEDTDKRIAVYVRELERSRTSETLYTELGRGIRAALKTQPEPLPVSKPPVNVPELTVVKAESELAARPAAQPPAGLQAMPPAEPVSLNPPSQRQIRTQIEILVNQGFSPGEIASRLGISMTEVELAMNLLRRKL